jgi:hypothetical protein
MDLKVLRCVVAAFCVAVLSGVEANAQVNVTQEHNNPSRSVNPRRPGGAPDPFPTLIRPEKFLWTKMIDS